jgi:hypothetical protein
MGIGSYKEAERYRMRTNKNLTRSFYLDTRRTLDQEPFAWEQVQNTPAPETDYNTEVDPGMVVPPQDILPKNPIPNMPSAPGIPDPQFRQFELANGGRVNFSEGSKLTGTGKTLEQNIKDDHKAFNDYRKSIGQSTIPLDNAFIKMWQRTRLSEGGRVSFKKGGKVIEKEYLINFMKENSGVSHLEKSKKLNKLGFKNSQGGKITDSLLEKFVTQNPELKGLGARSAAFTLDEVKQYARPKQLQDFESGLIDEETFRTRVNQYRGDLKKTPEQKELYRKINYERMKTDPEKKARVRERQLIYNEKRYLEKGMYPPSKNPKDALWRDLLRSADIDDRVSLVGKRPNKYSRDVFESLKLKDNETGKIISYKNLDKHPEYNKAIKPYQIKFAINQSELSPETRKKITYQRAEGGNKSNIVIQHNQGLGKNPFNTSLAIQGENIQESLIRDRLEKRFNAAETLSDKKQAINLFKKELENKAPNIVSQPGKKAYGVETDVEGLLKTSKVPAGERKKVINNLTNYLNNNPEEVKAFRTAGVVCRRSVGGKVDTECLAENIIKETEKLETGTDLQKASAFNKFKNATKLGAGLAEEVIGFGKGVAGRTLGPLVALNSALEQFTSGNYREGIRKIADIADLTTLVGDPLGFEKMRTEGTIEDVRGKIGKENQASLDRILEFKDKYYQLQDINTKLQRAESAAAGQYDPESPGVDPNYLNELKKQQADLNKIINSPKYQNIRTDYLNVGNAVKNEIFGRNINAPEQNKYTYETAAQEQLKSILGYDFYDELSDENKIIFKNLTASQKIKDQPVPFETPIQSPDDSMRMGFAEGGGPKMGRRGFLGLLTGIAAAPELIKSIKGTKKAAQAAKILPKVSGMPEWFNPLVTKIMKEGVDISPKAERVEDIIKVKKLEFTMPEEGTTKFRKSGSKYEKKNIETITMTEYPNGDIEIEADVFGSSFDAPFSLHYKPPKTDIHIETGEPVKYPGDFYVIEQRPKPDYGDPGGFEIDYEVMSVDDTISDLERIEKMATGKIIPLQRVEQRTGARKFVEENPSEDIVNRYGDSEIEYDRMKDEGLLDD